MEGDDSTAESGRSMVPEDESLRNLWVSMGPVEGYYIAPLRPGAPSWTEKIRQLRNMTLRDDDVFLFTYPKAGTHWLWEVMSMLKRGSAAPDKYSKVQMMMEFVDVDVLDQMQSPRIFNTHLPLRFLPVAEIVRRRIRTVHVYRNPKSSSVSLYHMALSSPEKIPVPTKTFQQFFQHYFFSSNQMFGDYFDYLRKMHEFQVNHPEAPSLNIAYEEVKKNPVAVIQRLADFLGLKVDGSLVAEIAQATSFETMKRQACEKSLATLSLKTPDTEQPVLYHPQAAIYRTGEIADWKKYFTVQQSETVDDLLAKKTAGLPFTFIFE